MRSPFRISSRRCHGAFTRIELAVVLAGLSLLALIALPLLANTSARSDQIGCQNNLRQIGIAFQTWGNDHDDFRPWMVPVSEGGSSGHPFQASAWFHYTFLSNHIAPDVLMDPAEMTPNKRRAENWGFTLNGGFLHSAFKNNAVSYMFSLHTSPTEAKDILSADRHVQFDGYGGCVVGGYTAAYYLATRGGRYKGWTNNVHGLAGNLLINDGHVEYASQERLKAILFGVDPTGDDHLLTPE